MKVAVTKRAGPTGGYAAAGVPVPLTRRAAWAGLAFAFVYFSDRPAALIKISNR